MKPLPQFTTERALSLTPWELAQEQPPRVVALFQAVRAEVGEDLLRQAAQLHRLFAKRPKLRRRWEPRILSGECSLAEVLEAIAA